VGFTNGCFDLLHPGHISLLRQSKGNCARLIVGLNSDASVRRLKGEERPIQSESARAQVLASLETIDLVVIFAEDTPTNMIEAIRPDVLIKGGDYQVESVVGAEFVQQYGGKVLLAKTEPGFSTSTTIEKLQRE
jgi:D-beta-D-heptose 7-phosphate kinase/D-beta-D-heptose 1-phosphate adenosyltransferase